MDYRLFRILKNFIGLVFTYAVWYVILVVLVPEFLIAEWWIQSFMTFGFIALSYYLGSVVFILIEITMIVIEKMIVKEAK